MPKQTKTKPAAQATRGRKPATGKATARERIPLAQRSSSFEWRRRWFEVSRAHDDRLLEQSQHLAYEHKLKQIERLGPKARDIAGYSPAGAGSPWYCIGPRNVNGRVKALAVHPTNPDIIYAGAASGGVWKSSDGGQTWDALFDMQESLAVGAIGIAKSSPGTVYVGSGEWTPGFGASYPGAGVYVSTNSGATWSLRNSCLCRRIGKLVVDPTNPQHVWICGDAGLEVTSDGGVTWTRLRSDTVTDIALDPTSASTVFIGVAGSGFFRSTNGGTSFTLLAGSPTGAGVTFPQLAIGVSGIHGDDFIVIKTGGSIATSTNGGTTFTTVSTGHSGFFGWCDVIACAPDDEQILFAPSNSNVVYFANDGGIWHSNDKGATVRKVSNGLVITQFYNLGFWQPLSNVVGGGSQDNATNYTTSSLTWQPVYHNDGGWFVIDQTDPRTMYAEGQNGDLAKSVNGGATWSSVTSGITGTPSWEGILTMDPNNHLRLFYGTDRVLRTTDGCATGWVAVSQTLGGQVSTITVAASDSNRVYAGTTGGKVFRSDDGGNTSPWADKSTGLAARPVSSIWVDPGNRDHVVVSLGGTISTGSPGGAGAQSVFRSTNGGNSWTSISGDLPSICANAVVGDPSNSTTFYVATDGGVYRTTNTGTNWAPFDNGIPNVPVTDLDVDRDRKILYAGTFGRGAYRLDITPGVTKPQVDLYLRDDDLDTGAFLPSPSGLPDPLIPAPATADWWTSPDIKVNHAPFFTPPGTVFDGVDFDASLVHQDPHRTETNRIYLQVHNRGWKDTSSVSVRAFVADATVALPALPNALVPPAFNLSSTTVWKPVGPATTIPVLHPNRPVIVSWDFTFDASTATHTCCLAVVSSPDDLFANPATDIATLVTGDRHACLKNLHVVNPGPAPAGMTMMGVDVHNPEKEEALVDLIFRPTEFDRGTIALLLPKIELAKGDRGLRGVERQPLSTTDPVGTWYLRGKGSEPKSLAKRWRGLDRTTIWSISPTQICLLGGIRMKPGETLRGVLVLSHKRDVATDRAPRVAIEERIGRVSVGGSTFQVGYDNESSPARLRIRRLRIVSDRLDLHEHGHRSRERIWVKATLADDPERAWFRSAPDGRGKPEPGCLFDGYVAEGESLTLELLERGRNGSKTDGCLYRHRFDGPIDGWLSSYSATRRKGELKLRFRVLDMTPSQAEVAD
jgi:photosystem II stability/assembly factor-like uncharacterized protein